MGQAASGTASKPRSNVIGFKIDPNSSLTTAEVLE